VSAILFVIHIVNVLCYVQDLANPQDNWWTVSKFVCPVVICANHIHHIISKQYKIIFTY